MFDAIPFVLCDVFASRPFTGNQLAVFPQAGALSDTSMAALAQEFGWSEVTFVQCSEPEPHVRIWTPQGELPFAGHPTIGTAVVLAATGRISLGWTALHLGIGPVAVEVTNVDARGGAAVMTQRAPAFGELYPDRGELARALGLKEGDLADGLPAQMVSTGAAHFIVPLHSLDALGRVRPSPDLFPGVLAQAGARWAYVFVADPPGCGVAARARLIRVGAEDAATGSAAGPLGAYLVQYGLNRPGELEIQQGIEMGRPSSILVTVDREAGEIGAVRVAGSVHIWGKGELEVGRA